MGAIDYTTDDVKAFLEDGINFLVESLDTGDKKYEILNKIVSALYPGITCSELLTKLACKAILKKTIEMRMVDGYFVAVAANADLDTRSALVISISSCISIIEIFGKETLDKLAFETGEKYF